MAIVLGYHGCDKETAQKLLSGFPFVPSENPYDWLGNGSYFWEWDVLRAYEWAVEQRSSSPCVVGAVIELGNCLDLTTRAGTKAVKNAFRSYKELQLGAGRVLPRNESLRKSRPNELVLRFLDAAVIDHLHTIFRTASERTRGAIREFDTVRALFSEGEPLYENAGFQEKTHVQLAVRHPRQIRGVFRIPPEELLELAIPELYGF